MGPGSGGNFDQLIPGGENGDAGAREDLDLRRTDGCEGGDVIGLKASAGGKDGVAGVSFAAGGYDVAAGADAAGGREADAVFSIFNVLKHNDGIGACGHRRAGHDLKCRAGLEGRGWCGLASAESADNRKPVSGGDCGGLNGIAVTCGAVEGREVAVGVDGCGEDAAEGFVEREVFCAALRRCSEMPGLFEDEVCGLCVCEDHVGIVRLKKRQLPASSSWSLG